jgi:hypothetical protein
MATLATARSTLPAPPLRISVERIRLALLWLTGLSGAFVFIEPSPYEIMSLCTALIFAASGLTLQAGLVPLVALLLFYILGFWIALVPVIAEDKTLTWVLISCYLAFTAVFYAAMLADNTLARLQNLCRGFTLGAVVAALAGIVGFFNLVPQLSGLFMLYERARGTFNDPNVLGAFLVFPAMLALQRIYSGRFSQTLLGGAMLAMFTVAILLTFSRGAWGQLAVAALVMTWLIFLTSRSSRERLRIGLLASIAVVVLVAMVLLLISIDAVGEMFRHRALQEQSYDVGHYGRFGRQLLGFELALERPWGIGPFQFRRLVPEDPHNAFLNAFMAGGWLSGFCYLALICITLVNGLRCAFIDTPWRPIYLAAYSVFFGIVAESLIIDSDHWRHFFLLLGVLWGLMIAARPYAAAASGRAAPH